MPPRKHQRIINLSSVARLNDSCGGAFSCRRRREQHQRAQVRRGRRLAGEVVAAVSRAAAGHCTSAPVVCSIITYRTKN
jgi:hypothetical protein